jgi:hypothetical protein
MTVIDPRVALSYRLGVRKDTISLVGKVLLSLGPSTAAGVYSISLAVSNLGARVGTIGATYARWRIVKLHLFFPSSSFLAAAVSDDTNLGDELPTSEAGVYESRTSCLILSSSAATLEWKPVDPAKWYYTNAESSGSDDRLIIPATVIGYAPGALISMTFECFYTLQFSGSTY